MVLNLILCILSGMLLILSGYYALFLAFMSLRTEPVSPFYFTCSWFFGGLLLIAMGGWLYSFQTAARRVALVLHGVILLGLVGCNVLLYLLAISITAPPDPKPPFYVLRTIGAYFMHTGGLIGAAKGLLLLYGVSLAGLLMSRRLFTRR